MKKWCLGFVIACAILCAFLFGNEYRIEYKLIGRCEESMLDTSVKIIRSTEELEKLGLKNFDVDFDKHSVIVSKDREIEKIIFKKEKKMLKTHFIEVSLSAHDNGENGFVYLVPEKEIYFDERTGGNILLK